MAALPLATAEVCDANSHMINSGELRALQPIFRILGGRRLFAGPVVTVKVFEDNVLVRGLLEEKGEGRVLVVDGGGSLRRALLGGNIAMLAQNNGWAGIVINGCVRDVEEINECDIGRAGSRLAPDEVGQEGDGREARPGHHCRRQDLRRRVALRRR